MKLPIKKKYFDEIKSGKKRFEWRDAHITFICEETGETLQKQVFGCSLVSKRRAELCTDFKFEDEDLIEFYLGDQK